MKKNLIVGSVGAILLSGVIMGVNLKQENEELHRLVDEQENIIKSNQKEIIEYIKTIDNLNQTIKDKDNVIQQKDEAIKGRDSDIRNLEGRIKSLDKRLLNTSTFEVTAYTAGYESTQKKKGDPAYGLTSSGTYVKEGRTIACPPSFKFGTKVIIEGVGERTCEDRGGKITEGHIDLYMDNLNAAQVFGRKNLLVEKLT
jgi:3D (Asp-Asp-Asp) domain-containing protein